VASERRDEPDEILDGRLPILHCDECGRRWRDLFERWLALRVDLPDDSPLVVLLCRDCAKREGLV